MFESPAQLWVDWFLDRGWNHNGVPRLAATGIFPPKRLSLDGLEEVDPSPVEAGRKEGGDSWWTKWWDPSVGDGLRKNPPTTVDGSEIRDSPVEVGSLSHYFIGFLYIASGLWKEYDGLQGTKGSFTSFIFHSDGLWNNPPPRNWVGFLHPWPFEP